MTSQLPPKLYFRIGEVASLVGVEPHVLRYWEREFRTTRRTKSAKGQRVYSRRDVENLMRVRELLYRDGFTIAGARKRLQQGPGEARESEPPAAATEPAAAPVAPRDAAIAPNESGTAAAAEAVVDSAPHLDRMQRPREELLAIRAEIVAFLAEL